MSTIYEMGGHQHLYIIVSPVPTRAQQTSAVTAFNTYLRNQGVPADVVDLSRANFGWRVSVDGTQVLVSIPYKTRLTQAMAQRASDWLTARGFAIVATFDQADATQQAALHTLLASPAWTRPSPFGTER